MTAETRDINFGSVDHFLYVRLNCVCVDLGYSLKELVHQAYYLVVDLIDEEGRTHFSVLRRQFEDYADYRLSV